MFIDCRECPLRRTSAFRPLEGEELEFVRSIKHSQPNMAAKSTIFTIGEVSTSLFTLYSGWAFRYLVLREGVRQILDILLPGDLIGLQSPFTGSVRHSVEAVTEISLCSLAVGPFKRIFEDQPALSEALMATLLYEESRADRRLMVIGRQRPTERLVYFLLELRERLMRRGMTDGESFTLPLTYEHLADVTGVSRSQIGASLGEIRESNWAELKDGRLTLRNIPAMIQWSKYASLGNPAIRAII